MCIVDCWYKDVCNLYNTSDCNSSCVRYNEVSFLMESSGIPKNRQVPLKLTPLNDTDKQAFIRLKEIKDNIVDFVDNGKNLYICSRSVGNGKTSWSLKLILKYFDEIWSGNGLKTRALFIHTPTLLTKLKDFDNPLSNEYKETIKNCDLVIWDDFGGTKLTEFEYNQLLMLIDARCFNQKANIYTSNITTKEDLDSLVGARLSSRVYAKSEVIEFIAKDFRIIEESR